MSFVLDRNVFFLLKKKKIGIKEEEVVNESRQAEEGSEEAV